MLDKLYQPAAFSCRLSASDAETDYRIGELTAESEASFQHSAYSFGILLRISDLGFRPLHSALSPQPSASESQLKN